MKSHRDFLHNVILVSKRMIDDTGKETFDTYFGTVIKTSEHSLLVQKTNGETESLPFDANEELYVPAEEGVYELEDGSRYENPDYIAEFVVYASEKAWETYHA